MTGNENFYHTILDNLYDGVSFVDRGQLVAAANRFRSLSEQSGRAAGPVPKVTISVGATLSNSDDSEETLLALADRFMCESKSAGKDRFIVFT